MADKKVASKKSAPRSWPTGVETWASTSSPEQEDDLLDLTITIRFSIERQRR